MRKLMLSPCLIETIDTVQSEKRLYHFLELRVGAVQRYALYTEGNGEVALELLCGEREWAEKDFALAAREAISPCHLKDWVQDRSRYLACREL